MKVNQLSIFDDFAIQTELENVYNVLAGKIGFGDQTDGVRGENLDSYLVDVTASAVAGDDNSVTHDLKRVPIGFFVVGKNASADFYDGTGTNTETSFFIKCTQASTRFRLIII